MRTRGVAAIVTGGASGLGGAAIEQAEAQQGKARILVNCAGIGPPAKVIGRDGDALALSDFSRIVSNSLRNSHSWCSPSLKIRC